jgi:hypothetical protein
LAVALSNPADEQQPIEDAMSAVCILAPVVVAAWPAFSAAVVAAATSLGYQVASEAARLGTAESVRKSNAINLEIPRSEVVTNELGRDQRITVTREGVTVCFSRDRRGTASLCVTGSGEEDAALRAMGEELSRSVVQHYVYRKLMDDMQARGFVVVDEERSEDRSIRLKVRHWED